MEWRNRRGVRIGGYLLVLGLAGFFGLWEAVVLLVIMALLIEVAFFP